MVRRSWDGWIDWLEPRGAAGIGRPDCDLMVDGSIAPVELKMGSLMDRAGWFSIDKPRPDQISWQHRFYAVGGVSFFLIAQDPSNLWIARKIVEVRNSGREFLFDRHAALIDAEFLSDEIRWFVRESRKVKGQARK